MHEGISTDKEENIVTMVLFLRILCSTADKSRETSHQQVDSSPHIVYLEVKIYFCQIPRS